MSVEQERAQCEAQTVVRCQLPRGHKRAMHQTLAFPAWDKTEQLQDEVPTGDKPLRERVAEYLAERYGEKPGFQDLLDADAIIGAVRAEFDA